MSFHPGRKLKGEADWDYFQLKVLKPRIKGGNKEFIFQRQAVQAWPGPCHSLLSLQSRIGKYQPLQGVVQIKCISCPKFRGSQALIVGLCLG